MTTEPVTMEELRAAGDKPNVQIILDTGEEFVGRLWTNVREPDGWVLGVIVRKSRKPGGEWKPACSKLSCPGTFRVWKQAEQPGEFRFLGADPQADRRAEAPTVLVRLGGRDCGAMVMDEDCPYCGGRHTHQRQPSKPFPQHRESHCPGPNAGYWLSPRKGGGSDAEADGSTAQGAA